MSKQGPMLEWQMLEEDAAWPPPMPPPGAAVRTRRLPRRWRWWALVILLMALLPALVEGYREVREADAAMDRVEQEVAAAVVAEPWAKHRKVQTSGTLVAPLTGIARQQAIRARISSYIEPAPTSTQALRLEVRKVEVRGEYAMAEVWTYISDKSWLPAPYRQTRFFREGVRGWELTEPPDLFYQPQETLRAGRFTFIYGPRDADAVRAAAAQVEALDADLRAELGLAVVDTALTVKLITELATLADPVDFVRIADDTALYAPSPAILRLPAHISEGDALLQLVAGLLIHSDLTVAVGDSPQAGAWQNMTDGLRLWLLAEHSELPSQTIDNAQILFWQRLASGIMPRLTWFDPGRSGCPSDCHRGLSASDAIYGTMAAAFVDYVVSAYGREQLPVLIAGMGRYGTWEELLPAVYGVSAAEFEAGWWAWLTRGE